MLSQMTIGETHCVQMTWYFCVGSRGNMEERLKNWKKDEKMWV